VGSPAADVTAFLSRALGALSFPCKGSRALLMADTQCTIGQSLNYPLRKGLKQTLNRTCSTKFFQKGGLHFLNLIFSLTFREYIKVSTFL
jgi:hypothetical protein